MKNLTGGLAALLIGLAMVASPAFAGSHDRSSGGCAKCAPRKHYDSREVIKKSHDVDRSRVINTQTVVPTKRVIETNHLIVHENETRNVGTVEHNHTIIEKELILRKRNIDHVYVDTVVNLVHHKYHTQYRHIVEEREIPGEVRYFRHCHCKRLLQFSGVARPVDAYASAPHYLKRRY
jgi:hypothetical protein